MEAIYCNLEKNKNEEIHDFLTRFFNSSIYDRHTYYKDGEIQCDGSKRRSIEDIHRLVLGYYNGASIKDTIKALNRVQRENHWGSSFVCHPCKDIGSFVCLYWYNIYNNDEKYSRYENSMMINKSYAAEDDLDENFKPKKLKINKKNNIRYIKWKKN